MLCVYFSDDVLCAVCNCSNVLVRSCSNLMLDPGRDDGVKAVGGI